MRRSKGSLLPAILVSVLVHAGLIAFVVLGWHDAPKPIDLSAVPVTLISETREQAAPAPPAPPEPTPQPVESPPPTPAPTPPPPPPKVPQPRIPEPKKPEPIKPTPPTDAPGLKKTKPVKETPPKTPPAKAKSTPDNSDALFNDMSEKLSKAPKTDHAPPRPTPGTGAAAAPTGPELSRLQALLQALIDKRWNPNCDSAGAKAINPVVRIRLTAQGNLADPPRMTNRRSGDPVWDLAAQRAEGAARAADYSTLPPDLLKKVAGQYMNVTLVNHCP